MRLLWILLIAQIALAARWYDDKPDPGTMADNAAWARAMYDSLGAPTASNSGFMDILVNATAFSNSDYPNGTITLTELAKVVDILNANFCYDDGQSNIRFAFYKGEGRTGYQVVPDNTAYSVLLRFFYGPRRVQMMLYGVPGAMNLIYNQHLEWPDSDYAGNPGISSALRYVDLSSTTSGAYILSHEVGHFFGLHHPSGGDTDGPYWSSSLSSYRVGIYPGWENPDGSEATTRGDFLRDTPPDIKPASMQYHPSVCVWDPPFAGTPELTATDLVFSNDGLVGASFYDWEDYEMATTNFMGFWSETCMTGFTDEQNWIMHKVYDAWAAHDGLDNGAPVANQVYDTLYSGTDFTPSAGVDISWDRVTEDRVGHLAFPEEYKVYEIVSGTPTLRATTAAYDSLDRYDLILSESGLTGDESNDWFIVAADRDSTGWSYAAANHDGEGRDDSKWWNYTGYSFVTSYQLGAE